MNPDLWVLVWVFGGFWALVLVLVGVLRHWNHWLNPLAVPGVITHANGNRGPDRYADDSDREVSLHFSGAAV